MFDQAGTLLLTSMWGLTECLEKMNDSLFQAVISPVIIDLKLKCKAEILQISEELKENIQQVFQNYCDEVAAFIKSIDHQDFTSLFNEESFFGKIISKYQHIFVRQTAAFSIREDSLELVLIFMLIRSKFSLIFIQVKIGGFVGTSFFWLDKLQTTEWNQKGKHLIPSLWIQWIQPPTITL